MRSPIVSCSELADGEKVAAFLAGTWRRSPPSGPLEPGDLARIVPRLLERGAGALGWWRLRQSDLRTSPPARELRNAYRKHTLGAAEDTYILPPILRALRQAGVEPLLIKGWSVARLYPEPGLRPFGDYDLCVRPDRLATASRVLDETEESHGLTELHEGIPYLEDRTWDELFERSRLAPLAEVEVRILGPEDQLRQLCLHFWRHNCHRPLWLCDIGAALESLPPEFDWDYFLRGDSLQTDWTLSVLGLARRLLGAEVTLPPAAARADDLPRWLISAVLWKWGSAEDKRSLGYYLRRPRLLPGAVLYRWLDPIKATFRTQLASRTPMTVIQLASLVSRPVEVLRRSQRLFRRRSEPEHLYELHLQSASRFL